MGEPLLHPELRSFLDLAARRGYRVILTTNGTLLSHWSEELAHASGLHKVNLSLQAYEANPMGSLEDYVNHCAAFSARAAEQGILINLRLWNLDGAEAKGKNLENRRILDTLAGTFPRPWRPSRGGQRLAEGVYLNWGETFLWPDLARADTNERHGCYGLRDQIGILCDGTVVPCCLDHEGDIPLGNLLRETLEDILAKPRTCAIRQGFSRQRAVEPLCRRCGYANRFASGGK